MRDNDGRVILNAHVLGFLRRICKLLFWGIKPVFVFDGGAPVLKRSTIVCQPSPKHPALNGITSLEHPHLTHPSISRRMSAGVRKRVLPQHTQRSRNVSWLRKCAARLFITPRGKVPVPHPTKRNPD